MKFFKLVALVSLASAFPAPNDANNQTPDLIKLNLIADILNILSLNANINSGNDN
jgi:hypothetical protein